MGCQPSLLPDSQVNVRAESSVNMMATACRFVSLGNLVMHFTLLISVTCKGGARLFIEAPLSGVASTNREAVKRLGSGEGLNEDVTRKEVMQVRAKFGTEKMIP